MLVGLLLAVAVNWAPFPSEMGPLRNAMALDGRILPYAIPFVLLTTLVCGVLPALRATRKNVVDDVRQSGDGVTPRTWMRQMLVVGQLAMSLFLVVATLLFVRSQIRIGQADVGFDLDHGIVARFGLDQRQYSETRVRNLPRDSSNGSRRFRLCRGQRGESRSSRRRLAAQELSSCRTHRYSRHASIHVQRRPRLFPDAGYPGAQGREFDRTHRAGSPPVAIVNETFARTYFPHQEVIGQRVQTEDESDMIGLVRDHRIGTIGEAPQSVIYLRSRSVRER